MSGRKAWHAWAALGGAAGILLSGCATAPAPRATQARTEMYEGQTYVVNEPAEDSQNPPPNDGLAALAEIALTATAIAFGGHNNVSVAGAQ